MFQASGIRGNYPQFFLENDFLGQWDKVENLLVSGIIQARLGIGQQQASSGESNHQCESAGAALGSHCSPNKAHFTVLISKGVFDDLQADNQQAALDILDENNISFKVVDGMNPEHRCKREKLFRLSGIRGNYPQLFSSVRVDNHVYLGGYDWLKSCEIVNLRKILSSLEDTA